MQKQRVSNLEVKKINRNQIYRYISYYERVSKPDIALALGISMPTVLQNVGELVERKLVAEIGTFDSTGGRKAKILAPAYDARFAIGVDITQNHIGLALTDLSGNVLKKIRHFKPYANESSYYQQLSELAIQFLNESEQQIENFLGFGFSIPGIISQDQTKIIISHALQISDIPLSLFTQNIQYPCVFTNDANAAMIAEMYHRPDKITTVYLSLSNSVGGAIFTDKSTRFERHPAFDNLFLGDNCRSGEFGHMTLHPGGVPCYCGKFGCVDSYCSAKLLAQLTDGKLESFFSLINSNSEFEKTWDNYLENLAITVNTLRMAFDCQVIIGGYVGSFIEPYLSALRRKAARLNTFENNADYIIPCKFKIETSALGAAIRHIENFVQTI